MDTGQLGLLGKSLPLSVSGCIALHDLQDTTPHERRQCLCQFRSRSEGVMVIARKKVVQY